MSVGLRQTCLPVLLTAVAAVAACGADRGDEGSPPPSLTTATAATAGIPDATGADTTAGAAASATQALRTEKWIELAAGDCLADPPPSDPSVVTVAIVDCAAAHAAEVYARAPVTVNAAVAEVANRQCAAGFTGYTGKSLTDSRFAVTYLIDSTQDRTSNNPEPSTVICLLQDAGGQPLTGSARR